jgi:hypothetical protein
MAHLKKEMVLIGGNNRLPILSASSASLVISFTAFLGTSAEWFIQAAAPGRRSLHIA